MQSLSAPTQHCKGKKKRTSCIILSLRGEKGQRHPVTVKLLMKLCQGLSLVKKGKERKKTAEDHCRGRSLTTITPVSQSCSKNTWAQGWWHKREENEKRGTQVSFSSFYLLQDYQFHHIKGRPFSLQHQFNSSHYSVAIFKASWLCKNIFPMFLFVNPTYVGYFSVLAMNAGDYCVNLYYILYLSWYK